MSSEHLCDSEHESEFKSESYSDERVSHSYHNESEDDINSEYNSHSDNDSFDSDSNLYEGNSAKKRKEQDEDGDVREQGRNHYEGNSAKKRKVQDSVVGEQPPPTDENGHIIWYPSQRLGGYEVKSELGEGAFGRVLKVQNVKTSQLVALKVVKNNVSALQSAKAELIALTMIECRDLKNKSLCIKKIDWFDYRGHVCIAFPLLGGSVFDFMKNNRFEPFSIGEIRHISYQLCSAVAFLHRNGLIHTDLKPENMLLVDFSYTTVFCEKRNLALKRLNNTSIRLSDFGLVTKENDYHNSVITTTYYRPPEVILRLDWDNTCDIWSIGCILIELYSGRLLFPTDRSDHHLAMMEKIIGIIPKKMKIASQAGYFKNGTLQWDPSEEEEEATQRCKNLEDYRMGNKVDDEELFDMIRQMLVHKPYYRIALHDALTLPFHQKLPAHQR